MTFAKEGAHRGRCDGSLQASYTLRGGHSAGVVRLWDQVTRAVHLERLVYPEWRVVERPQSPHQSGLTNPHGGLSFKSRTAYCSNEETRNAQRLAGESAHRGRREQFR